MAKIISKQKFDLLAIGTRLSPLALIVKEISWWSNEDETIIGAVTYDFYDKDFGWIVLGRDENEKYRAIDVKVSIVSKRRAEVDLQIRMNSFSITPNLKETSGQGDEKRRPLNLISPLANLSREKLHPYFLHLIEDSSCLPAKRVISEIAPWLFPAELGFIRDFQTTHFNQRLWEIYLWAAFREMNFEIRQHPAPDFECLSVGRKFSMEATTVTRSTSGVLSDELDYRNKENRQEFLNEYMPIKFGSALTTKLEKIDATGKHYWDHDWSKNLPFVIAIADFHKDADSTEFGSMTYSQDALYQYLYGHRVITNPKDGSTTLSAPIEHHLYKGKKIPSGFFNLPNAENISGVLFTNAGTLSKFNRIGAAAGFALKTVKYIRTGYAFDISSRPIKTKNFSTEIEADEYEEKWSDELQLFHNPNAKYPLPVDWLPEISHHNLLNGAIVTIPGKNHVIASITTVIVQRD